jgi:TetR/AcrR family transcriptional regulator, cholesterol catabolism regulator
VATERSIYDEKLNGILSTSAKIFAEKGYHNASIRDISRATGVSLSGLYYYFGSKEELLYLIQDHALSELLESLEARLSPLEDPYERLRALMENHLTYFCDNMEAMKVMSHEATSLGGDFLQRLNAKKRRAVEITVGILKELRPNSSFDPRVSAFALFGMMNWLYTWYRPEGDVPIPALVDQMTRIFLYGYLEGEPVTRVARPTAPGSQATARE